MSDKRAGMYSELIRSATADRLGIDNTPGEKEIKNLSILENMLLIPIRMKIGDFYVSSGYRCGALNRAVGGAVNSQHMKGQAADLFFYEMPAERAIEAIKASGISYDQIIIYDDLNIVHVSYVSPKQNRMQCLKRIKGVYHTV